MTTKITSSAAAETACIDDRYAG